MLNVQGKPGRAAVLHYGCVAGFVLSVLFSVLVGTRYEETRAAVCADTLRLHILANSDTLEDQLLKLQVRDAVLQVVEPLLAGQNGESPAADKEQAARRLRSVLPVLDWTARRTLAKAGQPQTVRVRLETAPFAPKDYGSFALPGGDYLALRIELGEGEGHNWFCVLYPQLCLSAAQAEYDSPAENALVFGRCEVRSAVWDTAQAAYRALRNITEQR